MYKSCFISRPVELCHVIYLHFSKNDTTLSLNLILSQSTVLYDVGQNVNRWNKHHLIWLTNTCQPLKQTPFNLTNKHMSTAETNTI